MEDKHEIVLDSIKNQVYVIDLQCLVAMDLGIMFVSIWLIKCFICFILKHQYHF